METSARRRPRGRRQHDPICAPNAEVLGPIAPRASADDGAYAKRANVGPGASAPIRGRRLSLIA